MQPGPLIGKGFTAEVFAWGNDRVLKLFLPGAPAEKVASEFQITKAVHASGYPTPDAHELITHNGRAGFTLDRINGPGMVAYVQRRPWKFLWSARLLAELHADLHTRPAPPELRTQKEQIEDWINRAADLDPPTRQDAINSLPHLPEGNVLCHGDFHPDNILITENGPIVIDWSRATRGHPLGDVARTADMIQHAQLPEDAPLNLTIILALSRRLLLRAYLKRYFSLRAGSVSDLAIWAPAQKAADSAWRCSRQD